MRPSVKKLLLFGSTAPYSGALLALDFVGSRTSGQPYYMLGGVNYPQVSAVPGWTYTGGTAAGVGSYAAKADGSLQFFPSYTNLLTYSEQLDNAAWTKLAAPITADAVASPTGTSTADKITPTAASSLHYAVQSTTNSTGQFTSSVYAKSAGYTKFRLNMTDNATGSVYGSVDLTAGTVAMTSDGTWTGGSASISNVGNGWYRVTVTGTRVSGTSTALRIDCQDASGNLSFTGDGTSGIYIWGAQLELGSTASTYIPTTTAAVTVATPRITDAGYWAEESRTNRVSINNTNPTVTTGITKSGDAAATLTIVSDVAELAAGGLSAAVTGGQVFKLDNTSGSVFAQASISGGTLNTNPHTVSMYVRGSGSGRIGVQNTGGTISAYTTGYVRRTATITPSFTSAEAFVTAQPGSVVYFILIQLEEGSFATSPIPTTSVAVTRAADVGYVSGLVVPSVKTLFANVSALAQDGVERTLMSVNDGSSVNRVNLYRNSSNAMQSVSTVASTSAYTNAVGSFAGAFVTSAATSVSATEMVTAAAGATTPVRATSSVAMATVSVGTGPAGSQPMNGPIRRIVIYPRAFGNSELQAITTAGAY